MVGSLADNLKEITLDILYDYYKVFSPQNSLAMSIAPGTRVSVKNQELRFDEGRKVVQPIESTLDESWVYTI